MDLTSAITANPPLPSAPAPFMPAQRGRAKPFHIRLLETVASLRITVVLFALSILLVFFGTLAQVYLGTWNAVNVYFRTGLVWVPWQIFFPTSVAVSGSFPFPGGWLLGGLMLVNLLAAHAVRFTVSWKRSGILMIHAGLIVLMLSELVTGLAAVEGHMMIREGQVSNFVEVHHRWELAVVGNPDPLTDDTVVVPDRLLRPGEVIRDDALPCDLEVLRYMVNSGLATRSTDDKNPATAGVGRIETAVEQPPISGTDASSKVDVPSAYVTLKQKDSGQSLGTYLFSGHNNAQRIWLGGKRYEISLRQMRTYKPYQVELLEARQVNYPGSDKPKEFYSKIVLKDPSRGEKREITISMNDPLRYHGETFFQSSMVPPQTRAGPWMTGLQVVENPGWLMPYLACALVTIGMIVHFGLKLNAFLEQQGRGAK